MIKQFENKHFSTFIEIIWNWELIGFALAIPIEFWQEINEKGKYKIKKLRMIGVVFLFLGLDGSIELNFERN